MNRSAFPAPGEYEVEGFTVALAHTSDRHARVSIDGQPVGAIASVAATDSVAQYFVGRLLLDQHGATPTFRSSSWVGVIRAMVTDVQRQRAGSDTE